MTEIAIKFAKAGSQSKVFDLLKDRQWHCRGCEGKTIASGQYAGGGGTQGLQRGTKTRPGLEIIQKRESCSTCKSMQTWDKWTGQTKSANAAASIPTALIKRILEVYSHTDVIEQRVRQAHELIIDHRFPMERWGDIETPNPSDMSDEEIKRKFQLLKKDDSGNHNLLKSRACEKCLKMGKRGEPFGIPFWYAGTEDWQSDIPKRGNDAEAGCVGCGWYDFEAWRQAIRAIAPLLNELNRKVSEEKD